VIEGEAEAALSKARELKADIFGFGEALHRKYPGLWKQVRQRWEEEVFPEVPVSVEVTARLRRTEKLTSPVVPEEDKR